MRGSPKVSEQPYRSHELSRETLAKVEKLEERIRGRCRAEDNRLGECWAFYRPRETPPRDDYAIIRTTQNGKSRPEYVHRIMYVLNKGNLARGQEVNHLCQTKRCCKPDHLEAGTSQQNKAWDNS